VHYNPANENPFVDQEPALEECFRRSPTHYGVVVIELKYDAAGRVTNANIDGNDDARTRACLVAASKLVKHSGVTAENCGIAFGDMLVTDLPAIDITANTIVFGTLRIPMNTILSDDSPTKKIADLEATVAAAVQIAMAAPVSLHGPIVVRPEDATPMKVVFRVLGSVLAGGDDFVLAEHRGAGWEPLYKMTLPIVPVPVGTGGKWNPVKGQGRNGTSTLDDEHVTLSVLIEKDRMWIGLSRVNEFQEVPHDATQADKLVATLKEHKASAFFADRSDIEIAADDDVPYSDVLAVIAKAREVGFIDWQLTDPAGLAARPTL
jgi:hypothetical protein